ncbi:MAG: DUF4783 domain-containing protein [Prolixibacteraceae bacterium]|nr:DUF4783 domain-containing protein [Prolixibacteraceae bacterium]
MNNIKIYRPALMVFVFLISCLQLYSQVPEGIITAFKNGNSATLSKYFNQSIEMVVLENDDIYSKEQARQIISHFFINNKPEKFTILHQGGKDDSYYLIGKLITHNKTYRVYFFVKGISPNRYIHQLRIEEDRQ